MNRLAINSTMKITNKAHAIWVAAPSNTGEPENSRDKTYNEKRYRPTQHDPCPPFRTVTALTLNRSNCYAMYRSEKASSEITAV
jgi:hypothetical protein